MKYNSPIPGFEIRKAEEIDLPILFTFMMEFAAYVNMSAEFQANEERLRITLFEGTPAAEAIIAVFENAPIGFGLFFYNYSTFLAKPGLYLEDLYIKQEYRKKGFGKEMLKYLARLAIEKECARFEWSVLDWNTQAIDFYQKLGAVPKTESTIFRLTGEALLRLAEG